MPAALSFSIIFLYKTKLKVNKSFFLSFLMSFKQEQTSDFFYIDFCNYYIQHTLFFHQFLIFIL